MENMFKLLNEKTEVEDKDNAKDLKVTKASVKIRKCFI